MNLNIPEMDINDLSIAIIGAGNMGFRLGIALAEAGLNITSVYNRSRKNGEKLVRALNKNKENTSYYESLDEMPLCDLIIIAVSDDAIEETARLVAGSKHYDKCIVVHTSGATPSDAVKCTGKSYGVFYPLMTLSYAKNVNFKIVPFLIEASDEKTAGILPLLAEKLGAESKFMSSRDRLRMHAAAVFSCNFVNYMIKMAHEIVKDNPIYLLPVTIETVRKYFLMLDPKLTITGPARRGDVKTMQKHMDLLSEMGFERHRKMYEFISSEIMKDFCGMTLEEAIEEKQKNK